MKRQDKYPDTSTFTYYNANPHHRITGDCIVRAISTALEMDYNTVVMELAQLQCQTGYDGGNQLIDLYLKSKGWQKHGQPRKANNTKYTGIEFCQVEQKYMLNYRYYGKEWADGITISNRIVANIGGNHIVAIVDGKVYDHWNSTDGCIGIYWTK
jgi:hypothetical protein